MNVQQFVHYCATGITVLGVLMNIIFVYVIRNGTRTCVGQAYKNIMTGFAVCNIVFASMEFISRPGIHIYGTSIAVLSNGVFQRVKPWGFLSLCVFLGMYGVTTALLALHFVYRYVVVCRPHLLQIFHEPASVVVVILSVICWGSAYGFITFYCFPATNNYYRYANESIYAKYGVDANTLSFFCVFTHEEKGNVTIIYWPPTIGLFIVFIMMVFTFAVMIFCGLQMYRTLKKSSMSRKAKKLQAQLLKALVVQAVIPFFTSYLSRIVMYASVIMGLRPHPIYSFTPLFLTIYSVIDPIAIMLFVCDYRQVVDNLRKHLRHFPCVAAKVSDKVMVSPSTADWRTGGMPTTAF